MHARPINVNELKNAFFSISAMDMMKLTSMYRNTVQLNHIQDEG